MKKFATLLIMSLVAASVYAYDVQVDGIYYNLNTSDKTATVTYGLGKDYSGDVIVPESFIYKENSYLVTKIGNQAFYNCKYLSSIEIPNSVTTINSYAFYNCINLKSINLPDKLYYIDEAVFKESGLTSISIPNSVTYIYYQAFYGCTNLSSVILSNNLNCIDENAFWGCTNLSEVVFPNRDVIIRGGAFMGCSNLSSLDIPNEVTNISVGAFDGTAWYNNQPDGVIYLGNVAYKYKGFEHSPEITIKDGTLGIAQCAFQGCYWLTTVNIPNSVVHVGWNAFDGTAWYNNQADGLIYAGRVAYKYKGTMPEGTEIDLESGTTGISDYAFSSCSGLVSIKMPNSILNIGLSAFFSCNGLTSIDIPNSVKHISIGAFGNCKGLTSVTIGNSFIISGGREFYECSNLTSIKVKGKSPAFINWATFYGLDKTTCTLYVPIGSKDAYQSAAYWNEFENVYEIDSNPDTDISTLDNALYVEHTEGRIGGTKDISVKLKNSYPVRGFIFTMELPEGATINSWALSTDRLPSGATVSDKFAMQKIEGNKINVACSLNYGNATFTGNDGEIASVNVTFANDMEVGEYPIYLTTCDISDAVGTDNKLSDIKATLVLEDYVEGDANGDGEVLIGDVIAILNYIVGVTSDNFNEKAADVNGDGEILIGDVIAVLNIIVNQ